MTTLNFWQMTPGLWIMSWCVWRAGRGHFRLDSYWLVMDSSNKYWMCGLGLGHSGKSINSLLFSITYLLDDDDEFVMNSSECPVLKTPNLHCGEKQNFHKQPWIVDPLCLVSAGKLRRSKGCLIQKEALHVTVIFSEKETGYCERCILLFLKKSSVCHLSFE